MNRAKWLLALVLVLGSAFPTPADALVYLNASQLDFIKTPDSITMNSRYRLSQTNWDQMIAYSDVISTTTIVQSNNMGNQPALNHDIWDMTLAYVAGSGFNFTLSMVGGPSWNVAYTAPKNGFSPNRPYNVVELYLKSRAGTGWNTYGNVTDLAIAGQPTSGALVDMIGVTPPNDDDKQYLYSTSDLSGTSWTLTGKVQLGYYGTPPNLDERIALDLKTFSGTSDVLTDIPEPGTLMLLGGALAAFAGRRLRRNPK